MFAKVILLNKSSREDVIFDYKIPEKFEKDKLLGRRVLVPLGVRNLKKEGYIIGISENAEVEEERVKEIISFPDEIPFFDEKMLNLARFIQNEYMTGLMGALKLVMPSGIFFGEKVYVKLKGEFSSLEGESLNICSQINEKGGVCLLSDLKGNDLNKILKELERLGNIGIFKKTVKKNLEKNIKCCRISEKGSSEGERILSGNKRLGVRKELFEKIKEKGEIPLSEIGSKSALKGLLEMGLIEVFEKEIMRDTVFQKKKETAPITPIALNEEQKKALKTIFSEYEKKEKKPILLFGVTGSGKTEVYIRLIERVINEGKQVIVLVPEISLTPLITKRIYERFGDLVTITHSRLTAAERFDQWKKAKSGKVSIIIGPRSAVFAPFENLGAIIADEEHEDAYQSDSLPRYDARQIAKFRCREEGALYIAGSATPLIETFYDMEEGKYVLCELTKRAVSESLPEIEIVDMREELLSGNKKMFSRDLKKALEDSLAKNEQAMLFINRRGYASFYSCRSCGYVSRCSSCSVSMTYHAFTNELVCHYCGKRESVPKVCPECGSKYIKGFGTGTQKIEEALKKELPEAKVLRMDADTTSGKFGHRKVLSAFAGRKADVLIGTQMIAKGHDFPFVSTVGIMAADMSLNTGDFRDCERTYRIITQAAGRAGRGNIPGKVFIQAYAPDHYAIQIAAKGDYRKFYEKEIKIRKALKYPPFINFFTIMLWGPDEKKIIESIEEFCDIIKYYNKNNQFMVLGPSPAYKSKLKDMFRQRVIVAGENKEDLKRFMAFAVRRFEEKKLKDVHIYPALNPLSVI